MPRTFERAAKHVRQFICGLHGHDALFHFDQRHVSLVCVTCGYESPGWNVPGSPMPVPSPRHSRTDTQSEQAA
jgi:hypothetical protein